jgi:hypothetical protein
MDDLERAKLELKIQAKENVVLGYFKSYATWQLCCLLAFTILIIPGYIAARSIAYSTYLSKFHKTEPIAHLATAQATAQPIKLLKVQALPIIGTSYSAYALVQNPNSSLVSPSFSYTFTFRAADGSALGTVTGTSYITVSQQKYIIAPNFQSATPPASVTFTVDDPHVTWQQRLSLPPITVLADVPKFSDGDNPPQFNTTGSITNDSQFTLNEVKVEAIVFGKSGNQIAVTQTTMDTLAPNSKRAYKMSWPVPLAANVGRVLIQPEFNLLDRGNYQ